MDSGLLFLDSSEYALMQARRIDRSEFWINDAAVINIRPQFSMLFAARQQISVGFESLDRVVDFLA